MRFVGALCATVLVGSLAVLAPPSAAPAAATPAPCNPPTVPCAPHDPADGPAPELGTVRSIGSGPGMILVQDITVTGIVIQPDCLPPPATNEESCTIPGTYWSYSVTGDPRNPQIAYALSIGVGRNPDVPDAATQCARTHTCPLRISYAPANLFGQVTLTLNVRTAADGGYNSIGYSIPITLFGTAGGTTPPIADFTATPDTTLPGKFTFSSTSIDPGGTALLHSWTFGDGDTAQGAFVTHTYDEPGDYTVVLTVTNVGGLTHTKQRVVTVEAPSLGVSIALLDGIAPPLEPDKPVRVRVTVSASADGVGPLHDLRFDDGELLLASPADVFEITAGPTPPVPSAGFSLAPGASRSFEVTLEPTTIGGYTLSTGVSGKDAIDRDVTADATSRGVIGTALQITIALDPPFADQEEKDDGSPPKPVDVTATITLRNTSGLTMTDVVLVSLEVKRTQAGQLLAVIQTGGVEPGDDGYPIGTLAAGETRELTATFRADDDAEVEFTALATAVVPGGGSEIGLGKQRWSLKPKYLLAIETTVDRPDDGELLPAGETIRISGKVKNLSNTATLDLGPLYPMLKGNAGVMSLTYDTEGRDPRDLVPEGRLTLDPGESQEFSLRVTTSYSDPRRIEGDNRHGGTFAEVTFTPYGDATLEDGEVKEIAPEQIKASAAALTKRVGIDDSITIPAFDPRLGGSVLVGAVEGVWSATTATLWGVIETAKLPYTIIRATAEFQSKVWHSFSDEEKAAFAQDAGFLAYSVLIRNADLGRQNAGELIERVQLATIDSMNAMEADWRIGDYTSTSRLYTRIAADAIGQVVVPIALAKLAKSPVAVAAVGRAQQAVQSRMAPLLADLASIERLEELGPILTRLEAGLELLPEQLAVLYGIAPEELFELQKLATKYNFLLTVRSRHASSIEWINKFGALLKPEAIKVKTVSELDHLLGYRKSDIGSVVFRKPEVLKRFEADAGNIDEVFDAFLRERGFTPGTGEWENASKRVMERIEEWQKYEREYKHWDKRGWIDLSYNYKGNAVTPDVHKGTGQYRGFNLEKIGDEEYVVQMMDGSKRRFVPITGDIDGIAYTHLDGSPLTVAEHALLLEELRTNPLLRSPHGESATFVKGGVGFVVNQFKPGEAGLQIAPGGLNPRVVRLNEGKSEWASAYNYHLHWDGGFTYSGSYIPRGAIPRPARIVPAPVVPPPGAPRAIPKAVGSEPNVGRCLVTYSTAATAKPLLLDGDGRIVEAVDGGVKPSSLADQCFEAGDVILANIKPVTEVLTGTAMGADKVEIPNAPYLTSPGRGALAVGQELVVGAGTAGAEKATISDFGSIVLDRPLTAAHAAGEVIIVLKEAPADATQPNMRGLPRTGTELVPTAALGTTLVLIGGLLLHSARRRRERARICPADSA